MRSIKHKIFRLLCCLALLLCLTGAANPQEESLPRIAHQPSAATQDMPGEKCGLATLLAKLEEDPKNPSLLVDIAAIYEQNGDLKKSIHFYSESIYLLKEVAVKQKHAYEGAFSKAKAYEKLHFSEENMFPTELEFTRLRELQDEADEKYHLWQQNARLAASYLYKIGTFYLNTDLDDPEMALQFFEKALDLDENNNRIIKGIVGVYYKQKNFARAEKYLKKVPFKMQSYRDFFMLGDIRMEEEEREEAGAFYVQGVSLCINIIKSNYFHGLDLVEPKTREFARALAFFEEEIQKDIRDARSLFRQGVVFHIIGDYNAAREMYSKVLALPYDEDGSLSLNEIALLNLLRLEDQEEFLEMYHLLLILYLKTEQETEQELLAGKLTDYYLSSGLRLSRQGFFEEGLDQVARAAIISPRSSRVYFMQGRIYLGRGNHERAIRSFSKSISFKPDYGEAYLGRGKAHTKSGLDALARTREESAETELRAALDDFMVAENVLEQAILEEAEFYRDYVDLLLHLGRLALKKQAYFEASNFFQAGLLVGIPKKNAECHYGIGKAYKEMDYFEESITHFNLALDQFLQSGSDPPAEADQQDHLIRIHEIHMELSGIYEKQGDMETAEHHRRVARQYWLDMLSRRDR